MTYTEIDDTLFETGDILTETNILTYLLNNQRSMPHRLDLQTADRDVVSTVGETSIWAALPGMLVPANTLGTSGSIEVFCFGDLLYNNSAVNTLTLRVRFGGSTVLTMFSTDLDNVSVDRHPWYLHLVLANRAATNAQVVWVDGILESPATGGPIVISPMPTTAAIDTTVDQTLDLTAQWSASSANNSFKRFWGQALIMQN